MKLLESRFREAAFFFICCMLALVVTAHAAPVTGAALLIGSNNITIPLAGMTQTDCWVIWGYNPNAEVWITGNTTAAGGTASVVIWGAPLTGSTLYYAKGCDPSGCGNEISFTTAAITPLPTTTFGLAYRNITESHFNPVFVAPAVLQAYFNIVPATIFFAIFLSMIVLGLWRRNRGVRLVSVVFVILSPLIMTASVGLNFGMPLGFQALGQALLAAGIAGILLSFVKK